MGARSGGGGGMGRGAGGGTLLQKAANAMYKAFYSKGNSDYFNGSNSPAAVKANQKYEKAKADFKKVWDAKNGAPAFNDYSGAMLDVVSGNVGG